MCRNLPYTIYIKEQCPKSKFEIKICLIYFLFHKIGKNSFCSKQKNFLFIFAYKKSKNTLPPVADFKNVFKNIFCVLFLAVNGIRHFLRPCDKFIRNLSRWYFGIGVSQQLQHRKFNNNKIKIPPPSTLPPPPPHVVKGGGWINGMWCPLNTVSNEISSLW